MGTERMEGGRDREREEERTDQLCKKNCGKASWGNGLLHLPLHKQRWHDGISGSGAGER